MSSGEYIDNIKELPIQKLLSCFFIECEKQFRFLEDQHGFYYYSGLIESLNGHQVIRPYSGQEIDEIFWATTRYEKDDTSFEISFGGTDLKLEMHLCYNRINRLALEEFLQAIKIKKKEYVSGTWLCAKSDIEKVIADIAQSVKQNLENLLEPKQRVIDKAIIIHAKRLRQKIMDDHKRNVKEASLRAAKAFCDKDYRLVIEILMPYKKYIRRSDKKKLKISQKLIAPSSSPC